MKIYLVTIQRAHRNPERHTVIAENAAQARQWGYQQIMYLGTQFNGFLDVEEMV